MMQALSKHVFYPLWDLKDRSHRLREWKRLEEQQWWSKRQLMAYQWERLQALVGYAGGHSPYYRDLFAANRIDPENILSEADFRKIPVTKKKDIRDHLDRFISDDYKKSSLVSAKTGGSTGVSLNLYFDEACQEKRNAAQLMADRWAGWDLG